VHSTQVLALLSAGFTLEVNQAWARQKLRNAADSLDARDLRFMRDANLLQKDIFRSVRARPGAIGAHLLACAMGIDSSSAAGVCV
jgi:hypothetical protein